MDTRAVVRNAADPKQVAGGERLERRRARRRLERYRQVMATPEGRFVMWDLISSAGVFETPWSQFQMEIHRNIGRQDFGRRMMATLLEVDEGLYQLMETEARALARADNAETAATHTASATQQGEQS